MSVHLFIHSLTQKFWIDFDETGVKCEAKFKKSEDIKENKLFFTFLSSWQSQLTINLIHSLDPYDSL